MHIKAIVTFFAHDASAIVGSLLELEMHQVNHATGQLLEEGDLEEELFLLFHLTTIDVI